jgi:hypothetical protein
MAKWDLGVAKPPHAEGKTAPGPGRTRGSRKLNQSLFFVQKVLEAHLPSISSRAGPGFLQIQVRKIQKNYFWDVVFVSTCS